MRVRGHGGVEVAGDVERWFHRIYLRQFFADNKKPISGVTGDGFFWNSFSNQIRNNIPKAHSLLEAPPPDLAGYVGIHRGGGIIAAHSPRRQGSSHKAFRQPVALGCRPAASWTSWRYRPYLPPHFPAIFSWSMATDLRIQHHRLRLLEYDHPGRRGTVRGCRPALKNIVRAANRPGTSSRIWCGCVTS